MAEIDETSRELGAHSSAIRILNENFNTLNAKVESLDDKVDIKVDELKNIYVKGITEIKQLHERERGRKEAYSKVWKTGVSVISVVGVILGAIAIF